MLNVCRTLAWTGVSENSLAELQTLIPPSSLLENVIMENSVGSLKQRDKDYWENMWV